MSRRVVITGMGCVSPVGNSVEESWDNLVNGRTGVDHIPEWVEARYNDRPLTVGDVFETSTGEGDEKSTVRWKVMELEVVDSSTGRALEPPLTRVAL